jgi:ABC-type uncharacterized transport system permease subunit
MLRIRDELRRALVPVLALVTAFILGAVVIVLTDFDHLRLIASTLEATRHKAVRLRMLRRMRTEKDS